MVPLKLTVPELAVNVPESDQFPATERMPEVEVNAPPERVKPPESVILAGVPTVESPVKVPADWEKLPTAKALLFWVKVPAARVNAPDTVREPAAILRLPL